MVIRCDRVRTTRPPGTQTLAPGCPSPRASHPGGTARGGCAIIQFHWALSALPWRERAKAVTPYCNSKRGCEVGALCRSKSCAARPCTWSSYRTHRQKPYAQALNQTVYGTSFQSDWLSFRATLHTNHAQEGAKKCQNVFLGSGILVCCLSAAPMARAERFYRRSYAQRL